MKIGLLRHYKVKHRFPFFCNSREYDREYLLYEDADISLNSRPVDIRNYSLCFASDSKRAVETAAHLRQKDFYKNSLLREVQLKSLFKTRLKIPFSVWYLMDRIAWFLNKKGHPETRRQTRKRAYDFLIEILENHPDQNILIVSHGFFMISLRRQLMKMGFEGDGIMPPKNGKLYRFEKN